MVTHLERLEELDFVHQVGPGAGGDYSFKHVLTQESVYSTLVARGRSSCHAAVGRAFEELYPDRLEENAEILARHFDEAGNAIRRTVGSSGDTPPAKPDTPPAKPDDPPAGPDNDG